MKLSQLHPWSVDSRQALELQRHFAAEVLLQPLSADPETVAGVDVSCRWQGRDFFAAVVVLSYPDLELLEVAGHHARIDFPYIPGLLSFRELPVILAAMEKLAKLPDLVLVDGQGLAHPRRFGLASHLGLWLQRPTIGCAKSRLCGEHLQPGEQRGDREPLMDDGERIGTVLRSRDRVRPLYVSPGHLIDQDDTVRMVLGCGRGYRLPEPTRQAHLESNRLRLSWSATAP